MRLILVALVIVAAFGGGLAALGSLAREKPVQTVEKVVPLANLQ